MSKLGWLFAIFGIAFAVIYAPTMNYNLALATYHPKLGVWDWGVAASKDGPAMYWYGFVMTAGLGAFAVTIIAALIPERILTRLALPALTWIVPLGAMIYFGYVLTPYFTK